MYASLGQAAKATGLSRSTILRAIKAHRISAAKTDTGDWAIDPAELHRVFPPAAQATQQDMTRQATAAEQAATALQITALHDLAELLRRQLDDVRDDRDHWRGMAEAGQRLLAPPRRVPWWRRLAGYGHGPTPRQVEAQSCFHEIAQRRRLIGCRAGNKQVRR
jgi:excisionase family DNA binding protein